MAEQQIGIYNLTAPALMAHPSLFVAKKFGQKGKETGEPKYGASFVFEPEHPDLKPMKSLAASLAKAKWPGRDLKELAFTFKNGTALADKRKAKLGKDDGDFQRGRVVMPARSKYAPRLAMIANGKMVDLEPETPQFMAAKGKFFFGAEALAQFNFVAYDGVGNNPDGVTCYLNMVLITGKGARIAGGASAADVFKGYVGSASEEDPTAGSLGGLDDEIPF